MESKRCPEPARPIWLYHGVNVLIRLAHNLTVDLRRRVGVLVFFVVAAVLAGCGPPVGNPDFSKQFPLKVELKTFAVALRLGDEGSEKTVDRSRVDVLVREYLRRARSPLMISTSPGNGTAETIKRTAFVRERLVALGVRPSNILLQPGTAQVKDPDAVILSFKGYEIKVPECGVWTGDAGGFNPTNLPQNNWGCSYQRNFGLMLADPGVLIQPNTLSAIDAQYTDVFIQKYRSGEPISSAADEDSGVGDVE